MNNPTQTKDMNELNNIEEQTWELLLEVMSLGERHGLNSDILTPYHTQLLSTITEQVRLGRIDELKKMVKEWGYGEYPSNDPRHGLDWEGWADYRTGQLDALLNTKAHNNDTEAK